ncbi:hypothetical protein F5B18DRAFT_657614 [Nemania serpens]|nr:hypothetical protein F5B18DRAFT_657614 [Nemania serpens]
MDDNPFDWDVDGVVRELCSPNPTWVPSPKLPPAQELEARARNKAVKVKAERGSQKDKNRKAHQ